MAKPVAQVVSPQAESNTRAFSLVTSKITVRGLQRSDMTSFADLCRTREELDETGVKLRTSVVEHIAFENPVDDGAPTYFVGIQDGRVISHLGRMPTRFGIDGRVEAGSYFHDLYVHPDIRKLGGQGFFLSMKNVPGSRTGKPGIRGADLDE